MKRNSLYAAATTGLIATTLAASLAQAAGTPDDKAEIEAFNGAATSMTAAIRAAEQASGGVAFAAEFDHGKAGTLYEVDTVKAGSVASVKIDAASGKVLSQEDEGKAKGDDDDHVDPARLGQSLTEAIARVEAEDKGKVMAISAEGEDGKTHGLEIELATPEGTSHSVLYNLADGAITPLVDQEEGSNGEGVEDAG